MADLDPKKPLLGQQPLDLAPAAHADPYRQLSAHPGQKYGATGQTPTSSHAGLFHPSRRGAKDLERCMQPVRAPESSSNSTGRHAVTMADGCVLPVDPPNADRREPLRLPDSFEMSREHGIPLPDGSVLPVPSSKPQPPPSQLQERHGGGSLYPQLPRLSELPVPTPPPPPQSIQYAQPAQHQPYQSNYGYQYQPYLPPQPAQPFQPVLVQPRQNPYQQQYHYHHQQQQQWQQQQQLHRQQMHQQQVQQQQMQQQQMHQQQVQQQQMQPERTLEQRAQTTLRWDPEHLSNNQCFVACIVMTLTLCCLNIFGLPCVVVAIVLACKSAKAKSRAEFKEAVKQQTRSKYLNITAGICTYVWVTMVLPLITTAIVLVVLLVVNRVQ